MTSPYRPLQDWELPYFSGERLVCPRRGDWTSFQLVDELGNGEPYAGLDYVATDRVGATYSGKLDAQGFAKVSNHYCGPLILAVDTPYAGGSGTWYEKLMDRKHYPLPITELQVRAEQTRFYSSVATRREPTPPEDKNTQFFQIEVRNLVKHAAHLPPMLDSTFKGRPGLLRELNMDLPAPAYGVVLMPNLHTVLEIRPLRAFRPLLSTGNEFCALNLYQLALLATLSYTDFGQVPPNQPTTTVEFPREPSIGNHFGHQLPLYGEAWKVDAGQAQPYFPLYEEVPYSQRLEILPFDPELYPQNHPDRGAEQEHPAKLHFFDGGIGTQAYITHHDQAVVIGVRGTQTGGWDLLFDVGRDADALQVPFEEGEGKVHRGFYSGYRAIKEFILSYLDKFHAGQKIIVCGHSLGGAIAQLLAEGLRRTPDKAYDIVLYTYGAPRAGDADFVKGAAALTHYRMVNHNDPIPSVPAPWMDVKPTLLGASAVVAEAAGTGGWGAVLFATSLVRFGGQPYQHQGKLLHFMPLDLPGGARSAILWEPGCDTVEEAACNRALGLNANRDLPVRPGFVGQLAGVTHHMMVPSYIPNAWAVLRRWQRALEQDKTIVADIELDTLNTRLEAVETQLKRVDNELMHTSGKPSDKHAPKTAQDALRAERGRLKEARQRLETLRYQSPTWETLYGNLPTPVMEAPLQRWLAHAQNQAHDPLAMIPPPSATERWVMAQKAEALNEIDWGIS